MAECINGISQCGYYDANYSKSLQSKQRAGMVLSLAGAGTAMCSAAVKGHPKTALATLLIGIAGNILGFCIAGKATGDIIKYNKSFVNSNPMIGASNQSKFEERCEEMFKGKTDDQVKFFMLFNPTLAPIAIAELNRRNKANKIEVSA